MTQLKIARNAVKWVTVPAIFFWGRFAMHPEDYPVYMAFRKMDAETKPKDSLVFVRAGWSMDRGVSYAMTAVGPGTTSHLDLGTYEIWVKVVHDDRESVKKSRTTLEITRL